MIKVLATSLWCSLTHLGDQTAYYYKYSTIITPVVCYVLVWIVVKANKFFYNFNNEDALRTIFGSHKLNCFPYEITIRCFLVKFIVMYVICVFVCVH